MRLMLVRAIFLIFFVSVVTRLFYWQVIVADELQAKAEGQHFQSIKVLALRGQILFSDGSILATSTPTFTLFGLPKVIKVGDKGLVAAKLAGILGSGREDEKVLKEELLLKLKQDLFWVSLKKDLDLETKREIESLKISGIGFDGGSSRFYPEGSSSAHILGFVGSNAYGTTSGYFGLEGFYDGELKGLPGLIRHEKDALGLPILLGNLFESQARNGKSLVTNIDRSIQFIVETALKKGMEKYGAKGVSAVVMDPKTGAILAMASYPNYDPLKFSQFPKEYYRNPVVADSFEPGSTFKVLTMSAAINENAVTPDTKCDICSGPISLGGFSIKTWNGQYYPDTTMTEGIIHSDNTAMVFTSKKLGLDKFYQYLENFGLGKSSGVDLQDETFPDLRPRDGWREIDLATASFGQGIAVTEMQMIRAVASIANGGNLMEPHIVKEIKNDQSSFKIKPKIIRRVIEEVAAKQVTEMMVKAVDEGEAKYAKPKGFKVAGKTGTAQIPIAGHYDPNKTIASFVGFAPADNPKFVMIVKIDQPSSSIFGSETAAPTFFEIAKELFPYLKIAPSE